MGKIKKNKRLISILSITLILFLSWLIRYPLNRPVYIMTTYDKSNITMQNVKDKYYVLLKVPMRGINIEKDVNILDLNTQDLKPIKLECTKTQYDYLDNFTGKEQLLKIRFKSNYFNTSKFKLMSVG
ncbi:hypothetical protein [Candidatus Clostridium stratigraminis]|uniref:Uncharacterized protein n=1 Tax=Candidatus Clostridium stratigraminis TaxID=3381661 RepID=A0ABW8T4E5_9CLOT